MSVSKARVKHSQPEQDAPALGILRDQDTAEEEGSENSDGEYEEDVREALSALHGTDDCEDEPVSGQDRADIEDMENLHHRFLAAAAERAQEHGQPGQEQDGASAKGASGSVGSNEPNETEEDLLERLLEGQDQPPAASPGPDDAEIPCGLDAAAIDNALSLWASAVGKSSDSMQLMAKSLHTFDPCELDAQLNNQIALLVHSGGDAVEIDFVAFVKPFRDLKGRVVHLDDQNRVMVPSNFLPKREFGGCVFVVPNAGARVRKKERDTVAPDALRLRSMFRTAFDAVDGIQSLGLEDESKCCVCGLAEQRGNPVQDCPCCLLKWHRRCSSSMVHERKLTCKRMLSHSSATTIYCMMTFHSFSCALQCRNYS